MHRDVVRTLRCAAALLCLLSTGCGDDAPSELDASAPEGGAADAGDDGASSPPEAGDGDGDAGDGDSGHPNDGAIEDDAGDAAIIDDEPPQLMASTPSDGDDNLATNAKIVLAFSEPVRLGDDALRVRQSTPARPLRFDAELSDDGQRIELTLSELPDLPAELTLELGEAIEDLAGNPLDPTTLSFTAPVWQRLGTSLARVATEGASDVRVALDREGRIVVASIEAGVYVSRYEDGEWTRLGGALNEQPIEAAPEGSESRLALVIDSAGAPLVAFRDGTTVAVMRWTGDAWSELGDVVDPEGGGSYAPALALGADGEPVVAFDALSAGPQPVLRVRALQLGSWETRLDLAVETQGVRLAGEGDGEVVLAYQQSGVGIVVARWDGSSTFAQLGAGPALAAVTGSFALSALGAESCTLSAQGQGSVRWSGDAWSTIPEDLGLLVSSEAGDRAIAYDESGALLAAFRERPDGVRFARVYVQRWDAAGGRFQPLGPALNRNRAGQALRPSLALAPSGEPIVAFLEMPSDSAPLQLFVSRFNGDPAAPPRGLRERRFEPACLASAPADGSALAETGCFEDALGVTPVPGFIPFDVRSPLWTDGAHKRRFVMLPEGETIAYVDPGIWTLPAGTILMKEFSIEGASGNPETLRPVETRFLIVREGGDWERYSYEWNQDATAAVLRAAAPVGSISTFDVEDGDGNPGTHDHFFPNRAGCFGCHTAPGTVLGLQTAMLNRNVDYGGTVDNQLRALEALGVFGESFSAAALPDARFMPNPADTTYSLERRLRAYLHANCSSCHAPMLGMDLRIQNSTLDSGLCTKIVKGDLDTSVIYWRDVLRGNIGSPGTAPMPPLGTLITNPLIETLLTDWILDANNVCP